MRQNDSEFPFRLSCGERSNGVPATLARFSWSRIRGLEQDYELAGQPFRSGLDSVTRRGKSCRFLPIFIGHGGRVENPSCTTTRSRSATLLRTEISGRSSTVEVWHSPSCPNSISDASRR